MQSSALPSTARPLPDAARHRGPSLVAVSIVYVVLFLASVILPTALAGGQHFPSPFDPVETSARYFADNASAVRLAAFLLLGSALPLGIFAATAASRVQFLGMKVAGIHIALFGGIAASVFLAACACLEWVLSQPGVSDAGGVVHSLHLLAFAAGGPAHVATFGLLVAGISVVAGLQGFVPRWILIAGVAVAAACELSTLVFVLPAAAYFLPVGRLLGLVWMIAVALALPSSRGRA